MMLGEWIAKKQGDDATHREDEEREEAAKSEIVTDNICFSKHLIYFLSLFLGCSPT